MQINPTLHSRSAEAHPNLLNFRSRLSSYFFSLSPLLRVAQTLETAMGSDRWRPNLPAKGRAPLRLAAAAAVAAGIAAAAAAAAADPELSASDPGENLRIAVDGVVRSSRAIYTIAFITVDYKYSLRSLPPDSREYRVKLSEVHFRSAMKLLKLCEANRGFYVKAGQFVSSLRQVPKEYSSTLSSLQDQATPYHFKGIKGVIERNLGKELSDVFLVFDEKPIAAASIAQVHRGLLKDNQEVAIKVQYPGLEQQMKIDISTMTILSKFERILSEFERAMSLELGLLFCLVFAIFILFFVCLCSMVSCTRDFLQEAKNSERAARLFSKNKIVKIPHVFRDLTTRQVLTMQFCHGHKVDDLDFLRDEGINPKKVAEALMKLFAEMIFVHGFLHGDPHPGNILVSPKGRGGFSLVLLDHGIYRELDEMFRLKYCELWKALILLDSQKILRLGEEFGVGKYAKYFPVIFTGRTIESKSVLGDHMSSEEKTRLKHDLRALRMDDISSFMESLPEDFLSILRTDGLLRSIVGKLGAPRHVRLLAYAKYAIYGLDKQSSSESGPVKHVVSTIRTNMSYLRLRILVEFLAFVSQANDLRNMHVKRLKRLVHEFMNFFYKNFLHQATIVGGIR
ncbi:uncharacterized aarF domain-containing protein kinase 1 isoform X2 [Ananas comosus]|uniref:Uncharacterized aarF domain-containing protein kinase 1 isoform X2 n=1 Tax=Ananas comosus TaxID=4615 RepID=A0A6P5G4R1_ANACO|nr:uncharacterized aarF domain-containing protein kinase 1 isoform X2 [Ananas comosus]